MSLFPCHYIFMKIYCMNEILCRPAQCSIFVFEQTLLCIQLLACTHTSSLSLGALLISQEVNTVNENATDLWAYILFSSLKEGSTTFPIPSAMPQMLPLPRLCLQSQYVYEEVVVGAEVVMRMVVHQRKTIAYKISEKHLVAICFTFSTYYIWTSAYFRANQKKLLETFSTCLLFPSVESRQAEAPADHIASRNPIMIILSFVTGSRNLSTTLLSSFTELQ